MGKVKGGIKKYSQQKSIEGNINAKTMNSFDKVTNLAPHSQNAKLEESSKSLREIVKDQLIHNAEIRKHRLYIKLKKSLKFDTRESFEQYAMNTHPDVISVALPRRGEKMRFFYAEFATQELALAAMRKLKKRNDCYVGHPASSKIIARKLTKIIKTKIPKKTKTDLRDNWN